MALVDNDLIRGWIKSLDIRFALSACPQLCNVGVIRHDADPAAGAVFAEALAAASLTAVLLDPGEKFSIRWNYDGSVGGMLAEVNADASVRGLVRNPHVLADTDADFDRILGTAGTTVAVTRSENGKIRNSGETKCAFLDPASALAYFFSTSDQVETEIAVALDWAPDPTEPVKNAGALMLQAMPDCDLVKFEALRSRIESEEVHYWLKRNDLTPEERIRRIFDALLDPVPVPELSIHPMPAPEFRCSCSRERMKQALQVLEREDLEKLFTERPQATVTCQFCNTPYSFSRGEVLQ